jgi:GAF domain-containing protein
LDPRFAGNPMVTGAPHVRAYAGIPLYTSAGHAIGALCAIDRKPRQFTAADMNTLRDAARAIEQCIRAEEIESGPRQEDITGLEDIAGRDGIAGREDITAPSVEHPGPAHHEIIQALRRHVRRRREFEDASRRHEERLRALPGAATVYVSYWNAQLRCEFLNDAYCARFHCALEEIVGMPMPELYGAAFHAIRPYVLLALEGRDQTVARRIRLPGGQTATSMQCVPDPGAGSRIQGLYVIFAGQRRRASDA